MNIKWIGAALIVVGCGGFGFLTAQLYNRQIRDLRSLEEVIRWMICELEFRQTPLPQLVRDGAAKCAGSIREVLTQLAQTLEAQVAPDAAACMESVLRKCILYHGSAEEHLRKLGRSLGEFDLQGQISSMQAVLADCRTDIDAFEKDRPQRVRSYQTLGLCAGAALAILFV